MTDNINSIFNSAKRFFSGTLLSRVSGLVRDISMAYAFGASVEVAAFMVAFRLSHFFRRILGEGALQTAFTPLFEEIRTEDPKKAVHFFGEVSFALSLLLIFLILVLSGGLGSALHLIEMSPGTEEIVLLTLLMMPSLLFICLYGMNAAYLQCEKDYFTASVAPVAFNIAWIAGVWSLQSYPFSQAMIGLALIINIACFLQFAVTIPKTRKLISSYFPEGLWKVISLRSGALKRLLTPLMLAIGGIIATQLNSALDPLFARVAEAEGPAYLWYAIRLQQLPLALFGIALSSAILPPLSRSMKQGDLESFKTFLAYGTGRTLALMIPVTAAIYFFGLPSIELIFGHGDFSRKAALKTDGCLMAYAWGLAPSALVLILAPAFWASSRYKYPMFGSILSVVSSLLLNSLFIFGLGFGAVSVAFATSLSAFLNVAYLGFHLIRELGVRWLYDLKRELALICGATVVASGVFWLGEGWLKPYSHVVYIGLGSVVFFGCYGGVYFLGEKMKINS